LSKGDNIQQKLAEIEFKLKEVRRLKEEINPAPVPHRKHAPKLPKGKNAKNKLFHGTYF
jgi:hypothetical protein